MNKNPSLKLLVLIILVSVLSGGVGGAALVSYYESSGVFDMHLPFTSSNNKVIEKRVYVEESSLIEAREKVAPAVVSVIMLKDISVFNREPFFFHDPFFFFEGPGDGLPFNIPRRTPPSDGDNKVEVGGGTGFIITEDGLVLTNRHVVSDSEAEYLVILPDGTEYASEVVSLDPFMDIGVLRMKPKEGEGSATVENLPVVDFGDSDKIKVGQRVLAIGNALAEYENTTTAGIISATGRNIVASDSRGGMQESLTGLIQTDAAINPGNSGGPLINLDGQVIGVNTAIDSSANGIGFAIPINDIKPIIESIKKYGKIVRPMLGVRYIILTEEKAKELQLKGVAYGALLVGDSASGEFAVIPGGPADKAGLEMKDVILEVDGEKITVDYTLQDAIRYKQPGDVLKLKIWRSGEILGELIEVTLEESSEVMG